MTAFRPRSSRRVLAALAAAAALTLRACSAPSQSTTPSSAASTTASVTSSEQFAKAISDRIAKHWPHMAKIWPTYDYTKHTLVLFSLSAPGKVDAAYAITTSGMRELTPTEYADIEVPQHDGYAQITFNGSPSIAMSVNSSEMSKPQTIDSTYRVATHELVHFYYQGEMKQPDENASRAQPYPLDPTPRTYRQMIHRQLLVAYETPDKRAEHLAKARFWLDKYHSEFADEAKATASTDIAEGTARYTDLLGAIITGDNKPEEVRQAEQKLLGRDDFVPSAEAEAYQLGEVAGLLLDEENPQWKKDFYTSGQTLLDLLLKDIKPAEDSVAPEVAKAVESEVAKRNSEVKDEIADVQKAATDTSIPYLKIDDTDAEGSFGATGSFIVGDEEISTGYTARFDVGGTELAINDAAVKATFDESGRSYLLLPLTMKHSVKDGVLTVDDAKLAAKGLKVAESKEDGRTVYTVVVK